MSFTEIFRREREREREMENAALYVLCISVSLSVLLSGLIRYFVDVKETSRVIQNIDRRIEFIQNDSAKVRGRRFLFKIESSLSYYIQSTTVQQSNEFSYLCKDSTKISGVEEKKKRFVGRFKERRFGDVVQKRYRSLCKGKSEYPAIFFIFLIESPNMI